MPLIQFFRNKFLELSRPTKRSFIAQRLKSKNVALGVLTTQFYLEPVDVIEYYVSQGMVPLIPSCSNIQMVSVCNHFWKFVLRISNNKIYQPTVEDTNFSIEMNIPRNPHVHAFGADDSITKWLLNYAEAHMHDPDDGLIILCLPSRKLVYDAYENDFKDGKLLYFPQKNNEYYFPSESYFMRCWRTKPALKSIVLRKYLQFALCDDCINFRERRRFATTEEERKAIRLEEQIHWLFVHEERSSYYLRQNAGLLYPDECILIIADGADQSAYGLPHLTELDKFTSNRIRLPVSLMGVLVHGYRAFGFTYLKNIKHGTNIVIECLHHVLMDYKNTRGRIPPLLYLQLDNTSRQNKNKYMLAYLACLVAWGVVREVVLSFLPVGHTHEDIGKERNMRGGRVAKKERDEGKGAIFVSY